MSYKYFIISLVFVFLFGCKPEPRRPISVKSNSLQKSIAFNRQLNKQEESIIVNYIAKDSLKNYLNSENGFWYTINNLKKKKEKTAKTNDIVIFALQIESFKGEVIYSFEELGNLRYKIDKQDLIKGLQDGLKLMNEGDYFTFLFPSHKAYGYVGDEKRIGKNQPLVCKVKLIKINKYENK